MKLVPSKLLKIIAALQSAALIAAAFPAQSVLAAAHEPDWHIAKTRYKTTDYIVAGYEAKDFGIVANGRTDVTAKIQEALDALGNIGGGTLFLPAGRYVLKGTLKIPQGVTLAGDWQSPDKSGGKATGTILMAYSGRGKEDINTNGDSDPDSVPFITIEPNAYVRNLNIWYPEQTPDNPVPYPTTIRMYDPRTWGADSTRISNITFVNSYNAIRQGPYSSGCPNISDVYIAPLHTAVDVDGLADVGRFTNIHISPDYWIKSGLDNAEEYEETLRAYMKENATGIKLGRIDWSYLSFAEIEGCNHGMEFTLSHSTLSYASGDLYGEMTAWSYPNGQAYKVDISDCGTGLYVEGCSGAGMLVAEMDIESCGTGIETINGVESGGNLEISNSVISGTDYAVEHNGLVRMCIGNSVIDGKIDVQNSKLSIAGATYNNSSVTLRNNSDTVYNRNGATVTKTGQVILSGGNFPTVDNQNGTEIIYNNDEYIPPNVSGITEEPVLETKPYKPDIFVVTDEPYNAPHNEVKFREFNGPCAEDASAAIQKALDDAEANGGGIVFCPPGRYTINNQLTVADGVELRGAVDHTRLPMKLGTIFDTPVPENEFLNTSFTDLNSRTINGIDNALNGNAIFNEVPNPVTEETENEDGTTAITEKRSITVTPYGLRLFSASDAEQAHAFDHSTQLECGKSDSKYIIEAVVSPKSIKTSGEFFITLSRNEVTVNEDGTAKNNAKDGFRIANFKAENNVLELPGNVKATFSNTEMYSFRWELDLTDINNKTIKTTVIGTKSDQKGEIFTSEAALPNAFQGSSDNVGHILLQASKVNADKNPEGNSEIYVHGVSVQRDCELNEPAWIALKGGSGINGITFNCIGQKYLPSPNPSPYMIQGQGDNIYVKNIALRNVYDGIDFKTYKCDNHYINGVAGIAWHSEIDIANSADGVLANTQFNWGSLLYGSQSKLGCWEDSPINNYNLDGVNIDPRGEVDEPYIEKYMSMNLDCVTVDSCQNILLYNNFSIFGSSSLTMKGSTTGLCVGQGADASRLGMRVADSADVDFINTQIVSFYYTDSSHITADDGYSGRCDFLNLSAWSTPSANIRAGGGEIYVYNSTFNGVSRTSFADLGYTAYVFAQSGWINNSNANTVAPLTGEGEITFRDMFWNRTYSTLPETERTPAANPTPEPRAPLSPRPGTFYPLIADPVYTINFGEEIEFNRIQLIWDEEQHDDVSVNVDGTVLDGRADGTVLNILSGAVSVSDTDTKAEEFNLHSMKSDSIEITAAVKPVVKLYMDENLREYISTSDSDLWDGERLFDGILKNPNTENLSNNYYVAQFGPFPPDTADFDDKHAYVSLDDEYSVSGIVLYCWGSNGWYPKSCSVTSGISASSLNIPSPQNGGYPDYNPYVLSSPLNFYGDTFTVTFPDGGYSDVNNPDTKADGTAQNKFGFRIYEIELYGSKEAVWSSELAPAIYNVGVHKSGIPAGASVRIEYGDGSEITDNDTVEENTLLTITAPSADGYDVIVKANEVPLIAGDDGGYTYTVTDNVVISVAYIKKKLTVTNASPSDGNQKNMGYISVAGTAHIGDTVYVRVTENADFLLSELSYTPDGGGAVPITERETSGVHSGDYYFTMPAKNVTVSADFEDKLYTVTDKTASSANGLISFAGLDSGGKAKAGTQITVTAFPADSTYTLKSLTLDYEGIDSGSNNIMDSMSFIMPSGIDGGVSVTAEFERKTADTVTVTGSTSLNRGDTSVYTASIKAADGTDLTAVYASSIVWSVDSAGAETGTTIEADGSKATLTVGQAQPESITVTASAGGKSGNVTVTVIQPPPEEALTLTRADDGTITASASNLKNTAQAYNAILAIYDKTSKALVYTDIKENTAADTPSLTFDRIPLPDGDYTAALLRWSTEDSHFGMTPAALPLQTADNK